MCPAGECWVRRRPLRAAGCALRVVRRRPRSKVESSRFLHEYADKEIDMYKWRHISCDRDGFMPVEG